MGKGEAAPLSERQRALHALNRLSFGPRPGEVDAVLLRARGHMARQEFEPARILLSDSLKRWPDALLLWVTLSHALLQEDRDHVEADRVLREVLAQHPGNVNARQNLEILHRIG